VGLKRLELFTDHELRQELKVAQDEATRDFITRLLRQRSEQRVAGNKELFKDEEGRIIPGYLTTSELLAELGSEPAGTGRYASLAIEAIHRADRRAFPASKAAALVIFDDAKVLATEYVEMDQIIPEADA
jgi:hypothetical protein